jgi:hypothetical protein
MNPSKSPIHCVLSESSKIGRIRCPCDKELSEWLNRLDLGIKCASTSYCSGKKAMSPFKLCAQLLELKTNGAQRHLVMKGNASQSPSSSLVPYMVVEMEVVPAHPEPVVAFGAAFVPAQNQLKRGASEGFDDVGDAEEIPSSKVSRTC